MHLNDLDVKDIIYKYQTLCLSNELFISNYISDYDIQTEYRKVDDSVKAGSPILLNLWTKDGGGHAVVAINTYEDIERNVRNVVVYDNNYPGMGTVVRFNFDLNEITYGINKHGQTRYYRAFSHTVAPYEDNIFRNTLDGFVNTLISSLKIGGKKILLVACPVNTTITDQYGRTIDDDGANEIPNADLIVGGDVKMFILPNDLTYTVNVDAYTSGNFTLTQLAPLTNESASITSFTDIPVDSNTKASVIIDPTEVYDLKIDNDGDGTTDEVKEPDVDEKIGTYSIPLHTGWNLISIPLVLEDADTASVLSPISGNYSIVWEYNASDTTDNWKKYDPSAPFGNDLIDMEPGKGYWILMNSDGTLEI